MEEQFKTRLERANKLIFVKQYGEAEKILARLIATPAGKNETLVHLRLIEVTSKLGPAKLRELRQFYAEKSRQGEAWPYELCLAMVEQLGEMVPQPDLMERLLDILKRHGPDPALYYAIGSVMENQKAADRAEFNYQECVKLDPDWYPAYFGLSQIAYERGDSKLGDHFFYEFERRAPYNVYGNFDTHRRLSQEFLDDQRFQEAEIAIETLSEWWVENRGSAPVEVRLNESLALGKIAELQGNSAQAESHLLQTRLIVQQLQESTESREGQLMFAARALEEHGQLELALRCYKRAIRVAGATPADAQKIAGQFLSSGDFETAREYLEEAYEAFPDAPEIRFARLVTALKLAKVNVEDYLIGRERLRQLAATPGFDRVEFLTLLHSLLARFQGDPDIHSHIAILYSRLGSFDKAAIHFQKMFELDPYSRDAALRYASHLMQMQQPDKAMEVLQNLGTEELTKAQQAEYFWQRVNYHGLKGEYAESVTLLDRLLAMDPWNIGYLTQEVVSLSAMTTLQGEPVKVDEGLLAYATSESAVVDWRLFDEITGRLERESHQRLVYARKKLRYLFGQGSSTHLRELVASVAKYDAERGVDDFLKLLNTNFDGADVYWGLGCLFMELWQLETASMWFQKMIKQPGISQSAQARGYLELADAMIWRNDDLVKALEYAKLALDLGERDERAFMVLAHGYLRSGQMRAAQTYLESADKGGDPEGVYLLGLLHYRNGDRATANKIWKPLLIVRSESLRFHHIKQEILKYYYEAQPYLKTHVN